MTAFPAGCVDGLLADRYRLDERIAVGGMGEVWRGQDTLLGRAVAVKCLRPEFVHDPEFSERFRAEARHAAGLSHPGIASVYDYGEQTEPEQAAWLVMELVDGEPLAALLHRTGPLDPIQTLDVVGQAALALEAAHTAGVVHRDVKPGNLLVRPDGVVKVTDFGIARATDAAAITQLGAVVGTAYYLSPEQASGRPVTPASDVYSLGVVAYECLSGLRPFPGDNAVAVASAHMHETPPPLPASVPEPVRALVSRGMEKNPADRPEHAGDFGRAALALKDTLAPGEATSGLSIPAADVIETEASGPHTKLLTQVTPARPSRRLPPLPLPGRNHRRTVRLASAMLALVIVALSVRACAGTDEVRVPRVASGSTVAAATSALKIAHLDARQRKQSSTVVPADRVIGTDPAAGSSVDSGEAVTLIVSSGRPRVTVGSAAYIGKPADAVRATLLAMGLRPTFAYDGAGGPAGTVRSVTPDGSLTYGSAVTIHVVPDAKPAPRKHGKGHKDD